MNRRRFLSIATVVPAAAILAVPAVAAEPVRVMLGDIPIVFDDFWSTGPRNYLEQRQDHLQAELERAWREAIKGPPPGVMWVADDSMAAWAHRMERLEAVRKACIVQPLEDDYYRGLANGIILAQSICLGTTPAYVGSPRGTPKNDGGIDHEQKAIPGRPVRSHGVST